MSALFIACGALAREVIAIRDKYEWDAKILALPSLLHNTPNRIPDAVVRKIEEYRADYEHIVIVYGDCGTGGMLDTRLDEMGIERIAGPHCFEMYAGDEFDSIMEEELGTFFLTDYLTQSFDHLVYEGLGLDRFPELHEIYFGNYRRIVYLQQREDPLLIAKAKEAAEMLNLPLEIRHSAYGALESRLLDFMVDKVEPPRR
jgi:uncharacterized protein DUF1638